MRWIVGIDEVGRGPLAGPVCLGMCVAAADSGHPAWSVINGARDSKKLTASQRDFWFKEAEYLALAGDFYFYTSMVGHAFIDKWGITAAVRIALRRNLQKAGLKPDECKILLDGSLYAPERFTDQLTIIKGDDVEPIISFASIVAKVRRDRYMERISAFFPQYGFEFNKGYGTREHIMALKAHGPCDIHRRSFITKILPQKIC